MNVNGKSFRTVWIEGNVVRMINQPRLPHFFEIVDTPTHRETAIAISDMTVRGAGAIGATGGFGMAQVAMEAPDGAAFYDFIEQGAKTLTKTRPTAQNLFYAIEKVKAAIYRASSVRAARTSAVEMAQVIADEDAAACESIGNEYAATRPASAWACPTNRRAAA